MALKKLESRASRNSLHRVNTNFPLNFDYMASEVEGSNGLTTDNIGGEIQKSYLDEVKKDEIHVPLDDNVEEARAGLDKTSDIQYDVMHTSYNKIKKMALLKKVHWLVAIVVNVVCILGMQFIIMVTKY